MKGFFGKLKTGLEAEIDTTSTSLKRLGNNLPSEDKASLATNPQGVDSSAQPSYSTGQHSGYYPGMAQDQPSIIVEPTAIDILRYQYHHGTNLGSIYVIERWLHPSRFPDGAWGSSELESIKAWVVKVGIDAAKRKVEEHWDNAVTDADIKWLRNEAKCGFLFPNTDCFLFEAHASRHRNTLTNRLFRSLET
jgi:hypothetical protein